MLGHFGKMLNLKVLVVFNIALGDRGLQFDIVNTKCLVFTLFFQYCRNKWNIIHTHLYKHRLDKYISTNYLLDGGGIVELDLSALFDLMTSPIVAYPGST